MTTEPSATIEPEPKPQPFPRTFWTANLTELFERGAYYSMASFVVIYLGRLGMGDYWPSTLNGILWTLVYFLPILSGTIADQVGFRRALIVAFLLLGGGYFLMGYPVWFGGATLSELVGSSVTASTDTFVAILAGILLIGLGGSVVKPCISGTVQKTAAGRATLAFAIFYMVINIGSLFGRGVSYYVRKELSLSFIFAVAMGCALLALIVVLLLYRDPESSLPAGSPPPPKRSIGKVLLNMVLVLRSGRFVLFLLVSSGFNFLYSQVYNVLPLYLKRVVETDPAVDLYTMANPFVIVCFQLVITHFFGKMKPIRSMIVGSVLIGLSMLINIAPLLLPGGPRLSLLEWLPIGSIFIILTVAFIAFGELFTSARTFEYIGALAPKGQEGLFLGYANLPMAIGSLFGGPVGALIFHDVMCRGAVKRPDGLLDLDKSWAVAGWGVLMLIGLASAAGMWLYNRWLSRLPPENNAQTA